MKTQYFKRWLLITAAVLFCDCPQSTNNNTLYVDSGGIGVKGYVYSLADSLPLDSVEITLTSFKGTNLQSQMGDVAAFSDTAGNFICIGYLGYEIKNETDTIGLVHSCTAIFAKQGFIDTSFTVDSSRSFYNLKLYMRKSLQ